MTDVSDHKLTFGDLKAGDRFIHWPVPGDNSGHGGYMSARRVFTKIAGIPPRTRTCTRTATSTTRP